MTSKVFNTRAKIKESSAYIQYRTVSKLIMALWGVILYRIQGFLSPDQILNFRHLFCCDTMGYTVA